MSTSDTPRPAQPTQVFTSLGDADPSEAAASSVAPATPAPQSAAEHDPLVGTLLLGKWRVLQRLGAGGFGTVYKVEDVKGGWTEALKVLGVDKMTGADAEGARKRFLREAQIMKRLGTQSQHIVGLSTYDEDLEAGLIYFTMEYVQGKHLADVLAETGPWSVERTLDIALQTCDALLAAHEGPEPVVHRDLKLENLMLTKDRAGKDFVKVLDFGIAKIAEREQDSRLTGAGALGTPGYAAPEQLRAGAVDGRTDLFAFGVILYSLLTGLDPWMGRPAGQPSNQTYELMVATDRAEVRPMDQTGVSVPPAMEGVVLRLLRRNPNERFKSARDLKETLERLQSGGEEATQATLRVLTAEPGIEVVVRSGMAVVARGPTPLSAEGLDPGQYRVSIRDPRFESVESPVILRAGALRDVTLIATPKQKGFALSRGAALIGGAALLVVVVGGLAFYQMRARPAVASTGSAAETSRLVARAVSAQALGRYYGYDGDDVRGYAERAAALDPQSAEAQSLLKKVAERLSWDADAALAEGNAQRAGDLARQCLALVPDHPRCLASRGGA